MIQPKLESEKRLFKTWACCFKRVLYVLPQANWALLTDRQAVFVFRLLCIRCYRQKGVEQNTNVRFAQLPLHVGHRSTRCLRFRNTDVARRAPGGYAPENSKISSHFVLLEAVFQNKILLLA